MKILTFMCADLFHRGHLNLLERASKMGTLIVGIPSDWQIEITKKKSPLFSFEDRLRIVSSCKFVDFAFGYATNEDIKKSLIYIKPDLYIRGDDWKDFPGKDEIKRLKIPIKYLPYTKGISSSILRDKICSRQCNMQK